MKSTCLCLLSFVFLWMLNIKCTSGLANLQIRFVRYYNYHAHDFFKSNCDIFSNNCHYNFYVCIDTRNSGDRDFSSCEYLYQHAGEYDDDERITFPEDDTRVLFQADVSHWPTRFKLKIKVMDHDRNRDDLIDYIAGIVTSTPARSSWEAEWHEGNWTGQREDHPTTMLYVYRSFCQQYYYGPSCDVYCFPSDSPQTGYYTCNQQTGEKICRPGYELPESDCTTWYNDCNVGACGEHGECVDGQQTYTCDCEMGYTGDACETEVDHCESSPCVHGTCASERTHYYCTCDTWYFGTNCHQHACDEEICMNGGSCYDDGKCDCPQGFAGPLCEVDVCDILQCKHGGVCIDGACVCPAGYTMIDCSVAMCDIVTCLHDGVCVDGECVCSVGYTGNQCQNEINECMNNTSCLNDGTCVDEVGGYHCDCPLQYEGQHCESARPHPPQPHVQQLTARPQDYTTTPCPDGNCYNECDSNPCVHGDCIDDIGFYSCECEAGFAGHQCQVDLCDLVQCKHGGSCVLGQCVCVPGYQGADCSVDICAILDCDHGSCEQGECHCDPGFRGQHCDLQVDDCESSPCAIHARCVDLTEAYRCDCLPAYIGTHCETLIPQTTAATATEVIVSPCTNNQCQFGTCTAIADTYICQCQPYYYGQYCDEHVCDRPGHCNHGGTCIGDGECLCTDGYVGPRCELDLCDVISCENGGTCIDGNCVCPPAYTAGDCSVEICELYACLHGGSCVVDVCVCPDGYTGKHCETELDDCASSPCEHDGVCIDIYSGYGCVCSEEYEGVNCEIVKSTGPCGDEDCVTVAPIDPCATADPCLHGATCVAIGNMATCVCDHGYYGATCELDTCDVIQCHNGGTCVHGVCVCMEGFVGSDCSVDVCKLTGCQHGATCQSGLCICQPHYTGVRCETRVSACQSSPCQHHGVCVDQYDGGYVCVCQPDYTGQMCEAHIPQQQDPSTTQVPRSTPCSSHPCLQGRCYAASPDTDPSPLSFLCASGAVGYQCVRDALLDYICYCDVGYTGVRCDVSVCDGQQRQQHCLHGGVCYNHGLCRCPAGYYGARCEHEACEVMQCEHGGTCTHGRCHCTDGYVGHDCSLRLCDLKTCLHGGRCVDGQCRCTDMYTGDNCESPVQEMSSTTTSANSEQQEYKDPAIAAVKTEEDSTKLPLVVIIGILSALFGLILLALLLFLLLRCGRKRKNKARRDSSRSLGDGESLYDNPAFESAQHNNPTYGVNAIPVRNPADVGAVAGKAHLFFPSKIVDEKKLPLPGDEDEVSYDVPFSKRSRTSSGSLSSNPYDIPVTRQKSLADSLSGIPEYDIPRVAVGVPVYDTPNSKLPVYAPRGDGKEEEGEDDVFEASGGDEKIDGGKAFLTDSGGTVISVAPDAQKVPL